MIIQKNRRSTGSTTPDMGKQRSQGPCHRPGLVNVQQTIWKITFFSWVSAITIVKPPRFPYLCPWDLSYIPSGNLLHSELERSTIF